MKILASQDMQQGSEFRKMPNFARNENASQQFLFKETSTGNSYTGENIVDEIAILRASLEKILTAILENRQKPIWTVMF